MYHLQKIITNWNKKNTQNYDGVKPPLNNLTKPQVSPSEDAWYPYPVYQINVREPYRVQHLTNPYGSLQTKLGTNLGS